jgi:hypothetical protein
VRIKAASSTGGQGGDLPRVRLRCWPARGVARCHVVSVWTFLAVAGIVVVFGLIARTERRARRRHEELLDRYDRMAGGEPKQRERDRGAW